MSERRGLLSDISWLQVTGSVLAAVTSAWLASRLGVAGTMIGVALGSFGATVGSAIYVRTLDRGKTLLAQTASGAVVERTVQDGEIAEALDEIAEADRSPVHSAEVVEDERELPWRKIIITTIVVAVIALTTITTIELVSDKSLDGSRGTTIGDTFGGSKSEPNDKGGSGGTDDDTKDNPATPKPTATPEDGGRATAPEPTASTPAPIATTPAPTPTAHPSPTATPDAPEATAPTPRSEE